MKMLIAFVVLACCTTASAFAADTTRYFHAQDGPKVSLQTAAVRNALHVLLRVPGLKGDNMLKVAQKFLSSEAKWESPKNYTLTRISLKNSTAELLHKENAPRDNVVLQLHGGAYILKLINIYRNMAVRYAEMGNGADVLSLDYRLAPEHVFPAALDDALDAWNWLLAQGYAPQNILVVGDSAGGNLALALTLKLRDMGRELPRALVCMSPWTDMTASGKSHIENMALDPIFGDNPDHLPPKDGTMPAVRPYILSYTGDADLKNPYLSPIFATYEGFPPMLIQVGTHEVLQSDSEIVYQHALSAGVDATLTRYYGLFHVFQLFGDALPESANAWQEVQDFMTRVFLPPADSVARQKPPWPQPGPWRRKAPPGNENAAPPSSAGTAMADAIPPCSPGTAA